MARALRLAERGLYTTEPNPRVGCVIVREHDVVGEGFHLQAGGPHAEVHALDQAGEQARGATAYVTLEPCSHTGKTPPCADALIAAGIARVVVAMQDPNPLVAGQGLQRLQAAGIEVQSGLQQQEAERLNPGFIKRMKTGRPWVRVKLAMSLDGRTAMASGESAWITGPQARADVQRLRARSSAILTGSGTVLQDNPSLNVRMSAAELGCDIEPAQPLRVVLDSRLRTPVDHRLFSVPGPVLMVHSQTETALLPDFPGDHVEIRSLPAAEGGIDLLALMDELGHRQINEVHVEAGATLCGALLQADLVDELVVYMAAHVLGDQGRGLFHLPQLTVMDDRIRLNIQDIRAVGDDWRIQLYT